MEVIIFHCTLENMKKLIESLFYFQENILVLFLHNSYGTPDFPDCGNLVGPDWMENLRWANTEPSMFFRETNTDPSMHFRKANTDSSMHFRKASFTPNFIHNFLSKFPSVFTASFNPNIRHLFLIFPTHCPIIIFLHKVN